VPESRDAYQTGSASVQVLVPPIITLTAAFAAWPTSLKDPISTYLNPSNRLPFSGGRVARNLRRRSERFDSRNSNEPIKLEIRGMSSAPPIYLPADALEMTLQTLCGSYRILVTITLPDLLLIDAIFFLTRSLVGGIFGILSKPDLKPPRENRRRRL
jgi:hypothetical protein